MISYVYPEPLPSKKARTISAVNTACSLSKIADTSLLYEKSGENILSFYNKSCPLRLIPISKKIIIRSNKIFNLNLKNYLNKYDFFYVRHLKTAEFLIKKNQNVIYELHEFFQDTNPKVKEMEDFVLDNANGVVVINQYLKNIFNQRFQNNLQVIRNGCGFEMDYIKKDFSNIEEIFYIGSFQPWKGVDFLVKNMKDFPHIKLNIIGGGDKTSLNKLIKKYDLKNINFLGFKTHSEIQDCLKRSKLTIIPNIPTKETEFSTPIKLYEYLMSSNIVLSADTLAIREIIRDGENGFLFKPGSDIDFTKKLKHILSLENKVLQAVAKNGYESVKDFTWDNRAKKIVSFAKSVI